MADKITLDTLLHRRVDRMAASMLAAGRSKDDIKAAIRARLEGEKIDGRTLNGIIARGQRALTAGLEFGKLADTAKLPGNLAPRNVLFKQGEFIYGANVTFYYGRSTKEVRYFEIHSPQSLTKEQATDELKRGSGVMGTLNINSKKNAKMVQYRQGEIEWVAVFRGMGDN